MFDRIKKISHQIQLKLENKPYIDELKKHLKKPSKQLSINLENDLLTVKKSREENAAWSEAPTIWSATPSQAHTIKLVSYLFPHYLELLAIACTYGLQEELAILLAMQQDFNSDIVVAELCRGEADKIYFARPLIDKPLMVCRGDGCNDTMLGIASFHGHLNLVKYLVEEQKANVDMTSAVENSTPLHKVVQGNSYAFHDQRYGIQHAEVAQYLLEQKANITIKNTDNRTPLEEADRAKLNFVSLMMMRGEHAIGNVRPILQKAQAKLLFLPQLKVQTQEPKNTMAGLVTHLHQDLKQYFISKYPFITQRTERKSQVKLMTKNGYT